MPAHTSLSTALIVALALVGCTKDDDAKWTAPNPPLAAGKERVRLVFGGDLSLARGLTRTVDEQGGGRPEFVFEKLKPLVADADLFFANVEMVLADSDKGEAKQKKWRIRAERRMAAGLKAAGLDVVSVANNHAHDFGAEGIASTLKTLAAAGIRTTGAIYPGQGQQEPLVVDVGPLKIAFLAFNTHGDEYKHPRWFPMADGWDEKQAIERVRNARNLADVVVVSMHWGAELNHTPWWGSQRRPARALVDAGADLVIGHGPHVVQPVETYKDGIIALSLGDLVFDKSTPFIRQRTNLRFLLVVDYVGKERAAWKLVPLRMDAHWRPEPWSDADTASWNGIPDDPRWSAREAIRKATVTRVVGDNEVACAKLDRRRGRHPGLFGRWLVPRWVCPRDERGMEIAASLETSGTVLERGVWASPHGGGPLRIDFGDVALSDHLEIVAGIPDFPLEAAKRAPPVTLRVLVEGLDPYELQVPHKQGWQRATLDTTKAKGEKRSIRVEVASDKRKEPGFLFDLRVH